MERIWKEEECSWCNLSYCVGICMDRGKPWKASGPPKYYEGMLPQDCSIWFICVENKIINKIQLTRIRVANMKDNRYNDFL
jgi:hypothetical protein